MLGKIRSKEANRIGLVQAIANFLSLPSANPSGFACDKSPPFARDANWLQYLRLLCKGNCHAVTEGLRPDEGIGPYIVDIDSILLVADF